MSLLSVEDLAIGFRSRGRTVRAVNGVSLEVAAGEAVGMVGESGSGKTVTGLALMGLLPRPAANVEGGSVVFDGVDLTTLPERRLRSIRGREIAMVPQDPMTSLNPVLTIREQLIETIQAHEPASGMEAKARAIELLKMVGIPAPELRLRAYPHEFSGGMRQRVLLAMALALHPRLLIADEPTTALDVTIQAQVLQLIRDLRSSHDTALLLITHDLGVIAGMTSRVYVMYAGEIVETGPTADVLSHPRHPYTLGLLRAVPHFASVGTAPLISIVGSAPRDNQPAPGCPFAPRCAWRIAQCFTQTPQLRVVAPGEPGNSAHSIACHNPATQPEVGVGRPLRLGFAPAPAPTALVDYIATQPAAPLRGSSSRSGDRFPDGLEARNGHHRAESGTSEREDGGPGGGSPLLEATDLNVHFPVRRGGWPWKADRSTIRAVDGVSFTVAPGESFALVGESGCGKTTLGRAVVRLSPVTSGSITFRGVDLLALKGSRLKEMRRHVQMIFQDPFASLDPRMSISGLIDEPLKIFHEGDATWRAGRVRELLDLVGLGRDAAHRYPHEFSGGQRQRVGIARALALNPSLIVADEPVSALDVSIQAQILNLLQALREEFGLAYVFVSHNLAVVRYISDRVGVMYLGALVETGPSERVFASPLHPYTVSLISAIPTPDVSAEVHRRRIVLSGEPPDPASPPAGCGFHTRCWLYERLGRPAVCRDERPALRPLSGVQDAACHFAEQVEGSREQVDALRGRQVLASATRAREDR